MTRIQAKPQVLIVDDDAAIRAMLALTLEYHGYVVSEADNLAQAQACLAQQTFAVIVLDLGLPPDEHLATQGLAFLGWLSREGYGAKVLVLTGQDHQDNAYACVKAGAFDFLLKPISEAKLLSAVERATLFFQQTQRMKAEEGFQPLYVNAQLGEGMKAVRNQAEEKFIRQVLFDTDFNVHETARRLGLKRENVYYLIKKYHIQRVLDPAEDEGSTP
ncbi:MAG: response regulator [Thiomicrospira sp.]|jgi:DNA-binding NtrC family response regulator|nr:response regulator [Thiomicrospira sp.]